MATRIALLKIITTYAVAMAILTSTMYGRYTLQFYAEYLATIAVALLLIATWLTYSTRPRARNIALASAAFVITGLSNETEAQRGRTTAQGRLAIIRYHIFKNAGTNVDSALQKPSETDGTRLRDRLPLTYRHQKKYVISYAHTQTLKRFQRT